MKLLEKKDEKRWKDKAPVLSGLVAEMLQATGDIGILDIIFSVLTLLVEQ